MKYFVRRLLSVVPTLVLVSVIIFGIMRVLPGDVALMVLIGPDGEGNPTAEELATVRTELGLDRPLIVQYSSWLLGMAKLDVGKSLWSGEPVFKELFKRFPLSAELGLFAVTISLIIAVPLGIVAAVKRGTLVDYVARVFALGGLSIPSFWVGVLVILTLVTYFSWTAPLGYVGPLQNPWTNFQQLVFPALALGYAEAALVSRLVRSSLLEVLREDYVRTARSKGLKERHVIIRHALRNSLLPVITVLGITVAGIIGGTVVMETVFTLPGVGRYMVDAINHRDYPVVQTLTFLFALVYALVNLSVDLIYAVIDPRIRLT